MNVPPPPQKTDFPSIGWAAASAGAAPLLSPIPFSSPPWERRHLACLFSFLSWERRHLACCFLWASSPQKTLPSLEVCPELVEGGSPPISSLLLGAQASCLPVSFPPGSAGILPAPIPIPSSEGWPKAGVGSWHVVTRKPTPPLRGTKRKRVLQQPNQGWTRFRFPSREGIKKGRFSSPGSAGILPACFLPLRAGSPHSQGRSPDSSSFCYFLLPGASASCPPVSSAGWKPALPGGASCPRCGLEARPPGAPSSRAGTGERELCVLRGELVGWVPLWRVQRLIPYMRPRR